MSKHHSVACLYLAAGSLDRSLATQSVWRGSPPQRHVSRSRSDYLTAVTPKVASAAHAPGTVSTVARWCRMGRGYLLRIVALKASDGLYSLLVY